MSSPLENLSSWSLEAGWVVLAIATHVAFLGLMPPASSSRGTPDPPDSVAVAIVEEEPEPPEPEIVEDEEAPEPEEPERVEPPPKPKTFRAPKEPRKAPEKPPAAAPETPVTFDNIVLTNEGDEPSSWEMDPGSGESRAGPIGRPDAVATGRSRDGVVGGVVGGTGDGTVVEVGDLSRQPIPPPLKRKLEKLYPEAASQEGVEGTVSTRLEIRSNGMPANIRIISEDPKGYGFGKACVQALRGEKWKPPLGPDGKPVTTRVTYRCGFEIRY